MTSDDAGGGDTTSTRCEWCGADYEMDGAPAHEERVARRPAPAAGQDAEPLTHCEWCGAEYPEPEAAPERP